MLISGYGSHSVPYRCGEGIMYENKVEKKLGIHTKGRDASAETEHRRPYEPTAYEVLDLLLESGYLEDCKHIVDYGSGKGRVPIYLSWKTGIKTTGVECNPAFYRVSIENQRDMRVNGNVHFECCEAETYEVADDVDAAFFFNPFSVEILKAVVSRLQDSIYRKPRTVRLFFYYPSLEYVGYLMTNHSMEFVDEIDCGEILRDGNAKECIMVFDLN